MLVITRRENESVVVYNKNTGEVYGTLQVVSIKGERVRIGLDFEGKMDIDRQEIYDEKLRCKQIAPPK